MVAASDVAPQHARERTPRPLPLFLDMVRQVAASDPALAAKALQGVRRYAAAARVTDIVSCGTIQLGPLTARTAGLEGPVVVLVPSLINPSWVMDLDAERSLLRWLGDQGFRAILLDWGTPTHLDRDRDLAAHVTDRLVPALMAIGEPVHLVGYCLGGVLAMAAAAMAPLLSLSLIATPWHFSGYGQVARSDLTALWAQQKAPVAALGLMPTEVLQSAFWSLDPLRTVGKFAALADVADDDPQLIAFARLEDWANGGAPLTFAAGEDLFEKLIAADLTGVGQWRVNAVPIVPAMLRCRAHQFTAADDRIAPAASAAQGIASTPCPSGHVGMMVGGRARAGCWEPLAAWLSAS